MKFKAIFLMFIITAFITVSAIAVPPGKELKFEKNPFGPITFSGDKHAQAGAKCIDCHTADMFGEMGKAKFGTTTITMKDIKEKKYCGKCHNGETKIGEKVVFNAMDSANCAKCHVKK
jgi:c(7)-type cytochrome triheme protein